MSQLTAVVVGSPAIRHSHHLYDVLRHTLATLANTTEAEMPVELVVKACDLTDRATRIARDRWWARVSASNVAAWGCGQDDSKTLLLIRGEG